MFNCTCLSLHRSASGTVGWSHDRFPMGETMNARSGPRSCMVLSSSTASLRVNGALNVDVTESHRKIFRCGHDTTSSVGLGLYRSLTQAVVCFSRRSRLTVRSPWRVRDSRHAVDLQAVRGLGHHRSQGWPRGQLVQDIPCGPCMTKIASRCISWVRRPSRPSASCWTTIRFTLETTVMRVRRRPRKRSSTRDTGSRLPRTSCPVVSAT